MSPFLLDDHTIYCPVQTISVLEMKALLIIAHEQQAVPGAVPDKQGYGHPTSLFRVPLASPTTKFLPQLIKPRVLLPTDSRVKRTQAGGGEGRPQHCLLSTVGSWYSS